MNILIVGNGFDLSHYLPTKYDHFMVAMDAIENWDEAKGDMGFDDLFRKDYWTVQGFTGKKWQNSFFQYTKAMYKTDEIKISGDQIKQVKEQLKENLWYQYFAQHVREVKTWIDFETKIQEGLKTITYFIVKISSKYMENGNISSEICFDSDPKKLQIFLPREQCNILELLQVIKSGYYIEIEDENGKYETTIEIDDFENGDFRFYIRSNYLIYRNGYANFKEDLIFQSLQNNLENFINIFNLYLELIVSKLKPSYSFNIEVEKWCDPDLIYSFNYTNTFKRLYDSVSIEYLHGKHSENQNIVLGISDLDNDTLKKLKVYGFTKYHQKLFKDTDYLFLDHYKNIIKDSQLQLDKHKLMNYHDFQSEQRALERIHKEGQLNLNFFIWGHSLDVSDQDYIKDLFSLNDDMDRNVRVIVYYFNKTAKFDLLNNLLAILGKDKVEHWMKNKWLQFKENPKIVPESAITLEDLPQT